MTAVSVENGRGSGTCCGPSRPLSGPTPRSSFLRLFVLLLAMEVAVGALIVAPGRQGADEDLFRYVGYAWVRGDLPYRDAAENKPPAIFLYWAVMEVLGDGAPLVGRLVALAAVCVTALLLGRIGRRLWGAPGWLAGPLFLIAAGSGAVGSPYADTETFGTFLAVAALALVSCGSREAGTPGRALAAGLVAGLATTFKPVYAIEAVLTLVLVARSTSGAWARARLLSIAAAGMAGPWLLALAYFGAHDSLALFLRYATGDLGSPGPTRPLADRIRAFPDVPFRPLLGTPLLPLVLLAVGHVATMPRGAIRWTRLALGSWAGLVLVAILIQGWGWSHQFKQLVPPLALLAAGALALLCPTRAESRLTVRQVVTWGLVGALSWPAGVSLARTARWLQDGRPRLGIPVGGVVEKRIAALTGPDDRIWVFPRRSLFLTARRLSASRHFSPIFLSGRQVQDELLTDLGSGRAALVLIDWDAVERGSIDPTFAPGDRPAFYRRLVALLLERFQVVGHADSYSLYRWRGSPAAEGGVNPSL